MKPVLVTIFLSMLVGVAMSALCTDQCNGSCDIRNTACERAVVYAPLCALALGSCKQTCVAVCGCVDGCLGQCTPAFESCKGEANGNFLYLYQCSVQRGYCLTQCGVQCSIKNAVSAYISIFSGGMGGNVPPTK